MVIFRFFKMAAAAILDFQNLKFLTFGTVKRVVLRKLLWTITQTINTLLTVVNFLKFIVTEVVLFSVVASKTLDISQGNVTTQLRYGGIFSANFLLILTLK